MNDEVPPRTGPERMLAPVPWMGSVYHFYHFLLGYLLPIALRWEEDAEVLPVLRECGPMDPWLDLLFATRPSRRIGIGEMLRRVARDEGPVVALPTTDDPSTFRTDDLRRFRAMMLAAAGVVEDGPGGTARGARILLLERTFVDPFYAAHPTEGQHGGTVGPQRRSVPNAEELDRALAALAPIDRIDLSTLPPREQVARTAAASVLVGQHGAGLAHMIWLPPGSAVVEVLPPKGALLEGIFGALAIALGHTYVAVWQDGEHAPVDPRRVVDAVRRATRAGAVSEPPARHPATRRAVRRRRRIRRRRWLLDRLRALLARTFGRSRAVGGRAAPAPPERWIAVPAPHRGELEDRATFLLGLLQPLVLELEGAPNCVVTAPSCGVNDAWYELVDRRHRIKPLSPGPLLGLVLSRPERARVLRADDDPDAFDAVRLDRLRALLRADPAARTGPMPAVVVAAPSADDTTAQALAARLTSALGHPAGAIVVLGPQDPAPRERLALLSACPVLIAVGGADPIDLLWMPAGAIIVELVITAEGAGPEVAERRDARARLAAALGQDHRALRVTDPVTAVPELTALLARRAGEPVAGGE